MSINICIGGIDAVKSGAYIASHAAAHVAASVANTAISGVEVASDAGESGVIFRVLYFYAFTI